MSSSAVIKRDTLYRNLEELIQRVEAARIKRDMHHIVKLVVVGKYTGIENIKTLYDLGQRAFGENQVQQLEERSIALSEIPVEWHMIGHLQKNKINKLIDLSPALLHSLDSLDLAEALDKRLRNKDRAMNCLLQINSAREDSKRGVDPDRAIDIYSQIAESFPRISLKGVMSIGAHSDDTALVRKSFEKTYDIFETLQKSHKAAICSMGMSGDFELAIECGSNMLRIGSLLFRQDR